MENKINGVNTYKKEEIFVGAGRVFEGKARVLAGRVQYFLFVYLFQMILINAIIVMQQILT